MSSDFWQYFGYALHILTALMFWGWMWFSTKSRKRLEAKVALIEAQNIWLNNKIIELEKNKKVQNQK